ncbi:hypothetical protein SO802_002593 [Lithocarpus litseifolius]|uniref:Uncharacterized protein n=1 Tax=Lithocarpus litseifolius TaxID=425828 RepID=A0AAW2DZK0_9ROSI
MERLQKLKQLLVGTLCHAKYVVERLNQEVNICGVIIVTKLASFPIPRYRIELKVEDDTGLATFILFDSTAEKLLYISAKELINKCSQVPEEFDLPIQIANLIGKTFVFQLELNDYNLKQGWEIYTVKKLFDPVIQTDNSLKLHQITDYYMSDATNDFVNNLPSEEDANPTNDASDV